MIRSITEGPTHVQFQEHPICASSTLSELRNPSCGAVLEFVGQVRNHHHGRQVIGITYEAYKPMAIRVIQEIICEGREAHSLFAVEVIHRVGYLEPGEISIRVSLSAAHRDACYLASAYIMGQLKARAPIWKLEHFEDGTRSWEGCKCARQWDPPPTFP